MDFQSLFDPVFKPKDSIRFNIFAYGKCEDDKRRKWILKDLEAKQIYAEEYGETVQIQKLCSTYGNFHKLIELLTKYQFETFEITACEVHL